MTTWTYNERLISPNRRALLSAPLGFEKLADIIAASAVVFRRTTEAAERCETWRRPRFELRCCPDLVDLLHNGRDGYRARYYSSEAEGNRANELLVDLLKPRLIDA